MIDIIVSRIKQDSEKTYYDVEVIDEFGSKKFNVTIQNGFYTDLKTSTPKEEIIKKSFEFLLKREPKEAILPQFDISIISSYFPEFSQKVRNF